MRPIVRGRILKKCGNKCVNCGATERLEVDHKIPLSRGWRHDEDNMQILCKTCNLKKGKSIDINQYFIEGDGRNYIYIRDDFPLEAFGGKEFKHIFETKIKELCPKYTEDII